MYSCEKQSSDMLSTSLMSENTIVYKTSYVKKKEGEVEGGH